ncbi:hypothetical protein Lesp01_74200 [Lentzea sp. NBRC 102530]|nr:hypothetical protein Lesp01_74200 [Lentzea sp. NBRC 102530]
MRHLWTIILSAVSGFLLLGLILNLADGTRANGLVIALYLALVTALVWAGVKLDARRAGRRSSNAP